MTPKKLSMVTRAGHIYRSKMENDSLFFDDKCDPLELLLMIFFGVVGFISSRSFL
jgi:hypothetical protein